MRLKILSYNIHKGFDWNNKNYCLQEMKDLINASEAEIVFLQEVVGKNDKHKEKGMIDSQFEFFADELWPHFSYAQNALYDHGHHGNLILSKYPIEFFENYDLSTNPWEKRGMLVCKIKIPKSEDHPKDIGFYAVCLHLNLFHAGRKIQYGKIQEYISKKSKEDNLPFIVAGDFNDWNQKSFQVFEEIMGMHEVHKFSNGSFARTFPSKVPILCLDRIYVKNMEIIKSNVVFYDQHLSDHLPIFCEVNI
ncbi:MAG: endonuclease/exonuclease/phosphatase family protein [Rhizobacter sp.]|nr:endonuclease/exonuclease/phosphatase family protein [Bacteriovorax sp.]